MPTTNKNNKIACTRVNKRNSNVNKEYAMNIRPHQTVADTLNTALPSTLVNLV